MSATASHSEEADVTQRKTFEKKTNQLEKGITVPLGNILRLLLLHDKFDKIFCTWNLQQKEDRDVLVVTIKPSGIIQSTLIYTICMMYPFRINGPMIVNNCLHVEMMHECVHKIIPMLDHATNSSKNIEYEINKKKRRHDWISGNELSGLEMTVVPKINITDIRSKLIQSFFKTNNTRTTVENTSSGLDGQGNWITFDLVVCERLNLDFMGEFQLSIDDFRVKSIYISVANMCKITVRFYKDTDRRITSEWEYIPVYDKTDLSNSFTAMRVARNSHK